MLKKIFSFPGGLFLREHLHEHQEKNINEAVVDAGIPDELVYPLAQHSSRSAEAIVAVGDQVLKGQLIAKASNTSSTPIHAASSGMVTAITEHAFIHTSGLKSTSIIIKTDKQDQWVTDKPAIKNDYINTSPEILREKIHNAGIIGMGGAGFPSNIKLNEGEKHNIDTLILNGAECEPHVTSDDMLMRERADEIITGAQIIMHTVQAPRCIIAIEDNKPEALASIQNSINKNSIKNIDIATIPTIYPAGGEKQLIKLVTNLDIGMQELPFEYGIVCHNVATAAAIYRAIYFNEPLISRIISVSGSSGKARNIRTLIGTKISDLLKTCDTSSNSLDQIIIGGPMMGLAISDPEIPVMKTTFSIISRSSDTTDDISKRETARACIRCGNCADVCPAKLLPQQLFWYAQSKQFDKTEEYNLFDCIECGCCDYVCPSHIPLIEFFRYAKSTIKAQKKITDAAEISRQRHEFRQFRLERNKQERTIRHKKKIDDLAAGKHKTRNTDLKNNKSDHNNTNRADL